MRRLVIAIAAAAALSAPWSGVAASAAEEKELLLFNWSNYMSPELLKRFEAETGIKVTLDTYDTNESMLAKLQAGGAGYDVVVPTGPTLQQMIKDGLVLKVDANTLSNYKNVKKPFDHPSFDPDRAYSVPYMWGTTGLVYDTAKVAGGKIDDTWKELFEPRQDFVGKIGMLKDMGEVITAAEYYLGLDQCTEKAEDGQKILELLEKDRKSTRLNSSHTS